MLIHVASSEEEIGSLGADLIEKLYADKPTAVLGTATGSSPVPLYRELVARHQTGTLSFAKGQFFQLDEYVGVPREHPQSYWRFLCENIVDHIDLPKGGLNVPDERDGNTLDEAAAAYDARIREAGGVDLQILGIGSDGHIGFNEPGGSLSSRTHSGALSRQTREDNARFFDGDLEQVPTHCITQGLGTIMEARQLLMIATGENKAEAVKELIEGGVSARWPATIIQFHPAVTVLLDEAAASQLEMVELYEAEWASRH